MKIEVLYPKQCNIFGDGYNIKYLKECFKDKVTIYYTDINEEPKFVKEDIDMIYMGSMTFKNQEKIVEVLKPYKKRLQELIDKDKIVLFTGDATEIVGDYIIDKDTNKKTETLGLFPVHFERSFYNRYNYFFLGDYKDIKIVGSASTFSRMYGENNYPFINVKKGLGMADNNTKEGINYKSFYATYLIGPFLILNPIFTKELLKKHKIKLAYEKDIMAAYKVRLTEMEDDNTRIIMGAHG